MASSARLRFLSALPPSLRNQEFWRYAMMLFWFAFCFVLFVRNMPYRSELSDRLQPVIRQVMDPLGLYHRGWGMFPGGTTGTFMVRITYRYADGSQRVEEPFPWRSRLLRSPWTEVMEVIAVRDNKNDPQRNYRYGYFSYQCRRTDQGASLAGATVEQAFIPLTQVYANKGKQPEVIPYAVTYTHDCATMKGRP